MLPRMPRWLVPLLLILTVAAFLPAALITRARNSHSATPRINIIPDMDFGGKFLPQSGNPLFADGRAMRPPIEGTLARGLWEGDDHFDRGRTGNGWARTLPIPADQELMARGKERYEVFCSPCHGFAGYGDGMINKRAQQLTEAGFASWTQPTSLHDEVVRARPLGHLFNTITSGNRTMPAYGPQIPTKDRWAIVAYVKALQLSQRAAIEDAPAQMRESLRPQEWGFR